jgi:hypothetical protein
MWALALIGVAALGMGVWEARRMAQLKRDGVRTRGIVIRYEVRSRQRRPVVAFRDEAGAEQEVKIRLGSDSDSTPIYQVGEEVPMVYLPGRPLTAQPDTAKYRFGALAVIAVVGVAFLAVAAWLFFQ